MKVWIVVCALLLTTGCASLKLTQAQQQQAIAVSLDLEIATVEQFADPGRMDPDHVQLILQWVAGGLKILHASTVLEWEAFARAEWPKIKIILGQYDKLAGLVGRLSLFLE